MQTPISRREMLRTSAGLLGAAALSPLVSVAEAPSEGVFLPSLYERAKLAISCLTEHCDKARGFVPYFYTRMSDRPPAMFLAIWSYGDGMGRSVDALALLRQITGEGLDQTPDRNMRASLIGFLGEEGLSWCPAEPWLLPVPHTRPTWLQQGVLLAFTSLFQLTGDPAYKSRIERLIAALDQRLVRKPGAPAAYPGDVFTHVDGWGPAPTDPNEPFSLYCASVTMPLLRYFRVTGYEPALRLASELLESALQVHGGGEKLFVRGHFHCKSRIIVSLLQRGVLQGAAVDLELGEKLYKQARSFGTQSGWFPEQINNPDNNRSNLSETCCLTDMLEAAVLLGQHRDPVYWHDAERFARNHLLTHQIVDLGWEKQMTPTPLDKHPLRFNGDTLPAPEGAVRGEKAMSSLLGGFAGWGGVTAMSDDSAFSNCNQHCCNAAGARAIYDAWHSAVSDREGILRVNLHLHRNHRAAVVLSREMPGDGSSSRGALQITMKEDRRLHVRVPEFVSAEDIRATANGKPVPARAEKEYVDLGPVGAGDRIEVAYPLKPRTTTEKVAPGVFTFRWRGATVVEASPVQPIRPLFNNSRFLKAAPEAGPASKSEIDAV